MGVLILLAVPWPGQPEQTYGVAFSPKQAEGLGVDWRDTYHALLDDLGIRRFRLTAYWDVIEPEPGVRSFDMLDEQMDAAAEYGSDVILSIGIKLPRWPECHIPKWAEEMTDEEQRKAAMDLMEDIIERYKHHPALSMWQLENEPFLEFGVCPQRDAVTFLREGEDLIRSLDPDRSILVTESGELSTWMKISAYGDVIGTTMYRTIYDENQLQHRSYDGIIPAAAYRIRARIVRLIRGKNVIISELQAEPWGPGATPELPKEVREQSMSANRLREVVAFAQATQLPEAYLWGAEYWYWMKTVDNDDSMWETARELF